MASPFATFRKYQAYLLAFFGVIIILVFAVAEPLSQWSREQRVDDPLAVTFTGGKLTQNQLLNLMHQRRVASSFMARLRHAALPPEWQARIPLMADGLVLSDSDLGPEATVFSVLLARKAADLGMLVSPQDVWEYLIGDLTQGTFQEAEIRRMIEGPPEDRSPYTVEWMLEPIRQQLLANKLYQFINQGLLAMPPAEQFAFYTRVNQKIQADVIGIPVDEFLDKVAEPSAEELTTYFERYKDKLPQRERVGDTVLDSPQPGFKRPHQIKVQYLKSNFKDLVAANKPKVTDAEIAKYYEEKKTSDDRLQQDDLQLLDPNKETTTGPASQPTGSAAQGTSPANQPSAAPDDKKAGDKTPPSATKTPTSAPTLPAAQDSKPAATTHDVAQASGATAAANQGTGATTLAAAQGTRFPPSEREPRKPKPLAEVKEYIRQTLAETKAEEEMTATFKKIEKDVKEYISKRLPIPAEKRQPLKDLGDLAKQPSLTQQTVGPFTAPQMADQTDIGKSYLDSAMGRQSFIQLTYANKGSKSLPELLAPTTDDARDGYLAWKLVDEEAKVPKLEDGDVRQEVIKQWKRGAGVDDGAGKARELALAAGNKLAAQLRKGQLPAEVAKSMPGAKLIETNPFSWLTYGNLKPQGRQRSTRPSLSTIDEIIDPGKEFMETAFGLKPGEVGVALNHPGTYVYVIQVRHRELSPDIMARNFVSDMGKDTRRQENRQAASLASDELSRRLYDQLEKDFQLTWKIPAEVLTDRSRQ
jgi:hypothetical protein